jgi:hypothetical protein
MIKITEGCHGYTFASTSARALYWIAKHAPKGSIVVRSYGFRDRGPGIKIPCIRTYSSLILEAAIKKAYNAGMFVVIPAILCYPVDSFHSCSDRCRSSTTYTYFSHL